MKVSSFLEELNSLAPFSSQLEWDNSGLLVGKRDDEIKGIYIALDLTDKVIENTIKNHCNLILTHHPAIFRPINRITDENFLGSYVLTLVENKINYVAMHTNYDVYVMGDIVSKKLGYEDYSVLDVTESSEDDLGIGTIIDTKDISLRDLSNKVKEAFSLPFVYVYGDLDGTVKRVAIVPGSGKSEIKTAVKLGADVLITGDITHHEGVDANAMGLSIIDAGHYGLEHLFIEDMKQFIDNRFCDVKVYTQPIEFPGGII